MTLHNGMTRWNGVDERWCGHCGRVTGPCEWFTGLDGACYHRAHGCGKRLRVFKKLSVKNGKRKVNRL